MKILEVRRHSIRSQPGDHLSQTGIALARRVGQSLGPFDRVITSTVPRAFETAIAMGFAVSEQSELMSSTGNAVEKEAPWPQGFEGYAEVIKNGGAAAKYAHKLAAFYADLLAPISAGGSVLVINHGGVVELGVVGCLPDVDFSAWGGPVNYCEGARLFWDGKFMQAEVLRVNQ